MFRTLARFGSKAPKTIPLAGACNPDIDTYRPSAPAALARVATANSQVRRANTETSRTRRLQHKEKQVELALYIALLIISVVLIVLVVLQARSAGMANRDTSSIYRTRRGLEKTMHQATIALGVIFLVLALIASLPIFA